MLWQNFTIDGQIHECKHRNDVRNSYREKCLAIRGKQQYWDTYRLLCSRALNISSFFFFVILLLIYNGSVFFSKLVRWVEKEFGELGLGLGLIHLFVFFSVSRVSARVGIFWGDAGQIPVHQEGVIDRFRFDMNTSPALSQRKG